MRTGYRRIPPTMVGLSNPAHSAEKDSPSSASITVERLERAITITAEAMTRHGLPHLLPTLKRLETERDNLIANGDPIAYAERLLAAQRAA